MGGRKSGDPAPAVWSRPPMARFARSFLDFSKALAAAACRGRFGGLRGEERNGREVDRQRAFG